ncbi:MAG: GTPase (G3E family), partial [Lachnospiraceae bacterium]|nr:GTPase (G3E family) [Lachnospiraceae bacterium]
TTFIKKYVKYLISKGEKVCILENDYGAVNVDMMIVNDLRGENCEIEMVSGGCDIDCHRRRFKTKLIAMGMSGYTRVIVEPSGVFDVDEFFDALYESPLDNWYEIGNVFAILDGDLPEDLSVDSDYVLASEASFAGKIIISKTGTLSPEKIQNTVDHLKNALTKIKCDRDITKDLVYKDWEAFDDSDFYELMQAGYRQEKFVKRQIMEENAFSSKYFLGLSLDMESVANLAKEIFKDDDAGHIFRIKGFVKEDEGWKLINATEGRITMESVENGQDVIIVIGENINEEKISSCYFKNTMVS